MKHTHTQRERFIQYQTEIIDIRQWNILFNNTLSTRFLHNFEILQIKLGKKLGSRGQAISIPHSNTEKKDIR